MTAASDDDGFCLWRKGRETRRGPITPEIPAVVLINPKFPPNVAQAVRNASAFNVAQVWYSGQRVSLTGRRLPREERMKGYEHVALVNHDDPLTPLLSANPTAVPVAVEVRPGCESLWEFEHPDAAIYVFGPEDGSLEGPVLKRCHRFVIIPSLHCLNLATSVGIILGDRARQLSPRLSVESEQRRRRA